MRFWFLPGLAANPARDGQSPHHLFPSDNKSHTGNARPTAGDSRKLSGEFLRKAQANQCLRRRSRRNNRPTFPLPFVKLAPGGQIVDCRSENPHFDSERRRNSFFATSQSMTCSLPSARRRSVSASSCACHAGDSKTSSGRLNCSHSNSISLSFSLRDIC